MAKKFFMWKDPNCNGKNVEWVEITGNEFHTIKMSKERKRYFTELDDGKEEGMDTFYFEATYEKYKEWHREHERKRRYKKNQKEFEPEFVSIGMPFKPDSELTFSETIPDKNVNVEEEVIRKMNVLEFREIRETLNADEQEIIIILINSIDRDMSERKICRKIGIPHSTFLFRKEKIFKKIKKSFDQNTNNRAVTKQRGNYLPSEP